VSVLIARGLVVILISLGLTSGLCVCVLAKPRGRLF